MRRWQSFRRGPRRHGGRAVTFRAARALTLGSMLLAGACESGRGPPTREAVQRGGSASGVRPTFVRGPTAGAPVAGFIAEEARKGRDAGYRVLVYVGASW